jgi:hypothetical protein
VPSTIARSVVVLLFLGQSAWVLSSTGNSEERGWLQVGGLLFGDFYHVPNHHATQGDDATGAVLRRGYLTFDVAFDERLDGRARFEMNQSGKFETYDYEADVKDLWVRYRAGAQAKHDIHVGLSPTPTFDLIESFWGLRYLIRTPMDLQGVASRDTGLAARGPVNPSGTLQYRAMLGTGEEFGNESGDGRKLMGALSWEPAPGWTVDLYLDHENLAGTRDRTTWQIFSGYQTDTLRVGAQYAKQDRQDDPPLELGSMFAVWDVHKVISLIGRFDHLYEPSPRGDEIAYLPFDPRSKATLFLGALEWRAARKLTITPNVVTIVYDRNDEGIKPDSDVHLRLTVYLNLE